jgi:hypothetical protein
MPPNDRSGFGDDPGGQSFCGFARPALGFLSMNSSNLPEAIFKSLVRLAGGIGRIGQLVLRAVVEFGRDVAVATWGLLVTVVHVIVDFCRWLRSLTVETYKGLVALVAVALYIVLVLLPLWAPAVAYFMWHHTWYLYGSIATAIFYAVALIILLPCLLKEERQPFKPHIALVVASHVIIVVASVGSAVYQYGIPFWNTYVAPKLTPSQGEANLLKVITSGSSPVSERLHTVRVGAWEYQTDSALSFDPRGYSDEEKHLLEETRRNIIETQDSNVILLVNRGFKTILTFEDSRPFGVEAHRGGKSMKINVEPVGGVFQATAWGTNESLVGTYVSIQDADGEVRFINFRFEE